jgi:ABC-2 type transport system ATP-binding protein
MRLPRKTRVNLLRAVVTRGRHCSQTLQGCQLHTRSCISPAILRHTVAVNYGHWVDCGNRTSTYRQRNACYTLPAVATQPIPPNTAISAEGIFKTFGKERAVSDINFSIPEGQILGMIGPSGCGKTTTLRLTIGIYSPSQGKISLMGKTPQSFSPAARRQIGYMPQLFVLYPQLTVWENLSFAASMYGLPLFGRKKRMNEVLEFVSLEKHTNKLARNISGGMQRRLSLAATLIHDPKFIFLDEPTAGIDPLLRRRFWDHFVALRNKGRTLFVTTQYVGEAAYCDQVAVMAKGRMLMVETPERLRKRAFGGEIVNYGVRAPLKIEQDKQPDVAANDRG